MVDQVGAVAAPYAALRDQTLFLVWGPPSHGPRSRVFARALGIDGLHYVYRTRRRGLLAAPVKYSYQAVQTLRLLFRERPRVVFVQSPPSFAVLPVYLYCRATGARYLIDAHSDALQRRIWTWPDGLHRRLARAAVTTIVTNEHFAAEIRARGGHAFVLRDIPTRFPEGGTYAVRGDFAVAVVNSFARDEPLVAVLAAARELPGVRFYVTGATRRAAPGLLAQAPANVEWTDFLPDPAYYALLGSAQAVMCLTTRDHTMQRGACEALSLGQPIVTSDWPLLREYFHRGTVHVDNTVAGIRQGIEEMRANHRRYQREIEALQQAQRREWQEKVAALTRLVQQALDGGGVGPARSRVVEVGDSS